MANIDTSYMELNPYTPQARPAKQEFLLIIPVRMIEDATGNTQAEIMQPVAQNIHANVYNFIHQKGIQDGITYDYIYFNTNNYFLIPLKRFDLLSYDISFIEEENNNNVGGGYFPDSAVESIEGSWYILHCIVIDTINSEYFTSTGTYITLDIFSMLDLSAWEPQVTSVPQNTIINAEDDITSYIYTENGWKIFANNTPNITDSETQLFIRGLVYGEDVEPHEDDGGTSGGDETIEGGDTK